METLAGTRGLWTELAELAELAESAEWAGARRGEDPAGIAEAAEVSGVAGVSGMSPILSWGASPPRTGARCRRVKWTTSRVRLLHGDCVGRVPRSR